MQRPGLRLFLQNHSGQDMIEYALMMALIGLGAVAFLRNFSNVINNLIFTAAVHAGLY